MAGLVGGDSVNFDLGSFKVRLKVALVASYFIFSLILLRLWFLQGLNGPYYRDKSENNRTRLIKTVAPRGSIFDRDGRMLVGSRPSFDVALMLEDVPDLEGTVETLAEVLQRPVGEIQERVKSGRSRPFEPRIAASDVSREELGRVRANGYRLPGVIVDVVPVRDYPFDSMAAHIFGYAREISKKELESREGYARGDLIGKTGLELAQETSLRGQNGFVRIEVDAGGRRKKELEVKDYLKGRDLHLSLDLDLQLAAQEVLKNRRGAVVALDPRNGDVLALYSGPSYDANHFSVALNPAVWKELTSSPDKPLNNRPLTAAYPPGSTFKLFAAVAGLAENLISESTVFNCPGYYRFGKRNYRCHKRSGHGKVNLRQSIAMSCNAYFYQLGVMLGIDRLSKYGEMFGFGSLTEIALDGEKSGILPSRKWKKEKVGEQWWPGDTIPVSIGQGYLTVTPLQLANAVAALVNGGIIYKPRLVRKVVEHESGKSRVYHSQHSNLVPLPKEILHLVRDMGSEVVHHERGTGKRARVGEIRIGGKTGTAQVSRLGTQENDERLQDHAWFISYAPVEEPMIVVAALVENAGSGGLEAAPVSHSIMSKFFLKQGMVTEEEIEEHKFDPPKPPVAATEATATRAERTMAAAATSDQEMAAELPSLPSVGIRDQAQSRAQMNSPEEEDF